jgi:hypothetical protein
MNRYARLIKLFVVLVALFALYFTYDRWTYERLLSESAKVHVPSPNVTFNDALY